MSLVVKVSLGALVSGGIAFIGWMNSVDSTAKENKTDIKEIKEYVIRSHDYFQKNERSLGRIEGDIKAIKGSVDLLIKKK